MSKVTHLSDVNALLRHAGVTDMPYLDFGKSPAPAADSAEKPAAPAAQTQPAAPQIRAEPVRTENTPAPAAPLDSTFDRLRRKTVTRRSPLAGIQLSLPERKPQRRFFAAPPLAERPWQEIWSQLERAALNRRTP